MRRYNQFDVPHVSLMRDGIIALPTCPAEGFLCGVEVAGELPRKKADRGSALLVLIAAGNSRDLNRLAVDASDRLRGS